VPTPAFVDAFAQLKTCIGPYVLSAQKILEAGGGSLSRIDIPERAEVTVIDLSPEQLERHQTAHHKILGDLHVVEFGSAVFDVAVIWDVVEHLENPGLVLDKLRGAVRPGGIIIIAAPNPTSLQGMITKHTPHWFHVFILRHVFKSQTAGLPGFPPFKTVHHADISPKRLEAWARRHDLEILIYVAYESTRWPTLRKRSPVLGFLWDLSIAVGDIFSSSALEASDYYFVVRAKS
jgi:2-polyprenyl-3-methyl-5-hydroxy-6-metoxy-1,4-benzoquinol methylase